MPTSVLVIILAVLPPSAPAAAVASRHGSRTCDQHSVPDQHLDTATVLAVDQAWSRAYAAGDTAFLDCLFSSDFRDVNTQAVARDRNEVMRAAVRHPPVEHAQVAPGSELAVQLHGRFAVVSGYVLKLDESGARHRFWYADCYVFDGRRWHAVYAQATLGPSVGAAPAASASSDGARPAR